MLLPLSWLKEYVDIYESPEIIANKLLSVGFEVEGIEYKGDDIKNVVVGKIVKIDPHTNSDHMVICQIDVGEEKGGVVQIVTGANNVFEGALVPAALVGAHLPNGIQIKKAKLRGVESYGMLCSGQELNITEADYEGASVNGIMILKDDAVIGQDIVDYLDMKEVIFDVSITANRPDCQSVLGISREVAAVLGKKIKYPSFDFVEEENSDIKDYIKVSVENKVVCPKYLSRVVDDVKFVDTPKWMKKRLTNVGLRSIDIFVDITNYVMMEIGQPMHAFDLDNLENKEIIVRNAVKGEKILLLNDSEIELDEDVLVIADGKKPVAIGGVMGGVNSGVNANAKTIAFESAKFLRDRIRKTSRKIGVRSDASARYEKGIDVYTTDMAMRRALHLVCETGAGKVIAGTFDVKAEDPRNLTLSFPVKKIDDVLGINVPNETVLKVLGDLEFQPEIVDGILTVKVPDYREDVDNFTDIAEEVMRYYGYDHINGSMMPAASITHGGYNYEQNALAGIKNSLVKKGYYEAITYSFTTPKMIKNLYLEDKGALADPVKILNPLGEDVSIMRTTLAHSMLETLSFNHKKNNDCAKLFELAKIYIKTSQNTSDLPCEKNVLCVGEYGANCDFYTLKGALDSVFEGLGIKYDLVRSKKEYLHPGRSADVLVDGKVVGYLGEVHPDTIELYELPLRSLVMEIMIDEILGSSKQEIHFKAFSKFPPMERDLAIIVDKSTDMMTIKKAILEKGGALLTDGKLFDVYEGDRIEKDKKSLAFRLKFSDPNKTLTDKDVEVVLDKILKNVEKVGGKLR